MGLSLVSMPAWALASGSPRVCVETAVGGSSICDAVVLAVVFGTDGIAGPGCWLVTPWERHCFQGSLESS